MRRFWARCAMVGAVILVLAVITLAQTSPWKKYSFPDDGFEATYPSPPDLQKKTVQTSAGEFELRSYSTHFGDTALIVGDCDYGDAVAGIPSGQKNSTLSNSASRLVSEKKITLGTNPEVQFEAENSATHFTVACTWSGPPSTKFS